MTELVEHGDQLVALANRVDIPETADSALAEAASRFGLTIDVLCAEPVRDEHFAAASNELADRLRANGDPGEPCAVHLTRAVALWEQGYTGRSAAALVAAQQAAGLRTRESERRWRERTGLRNLLERWLIALHHSEPRQQLRHRCRLDDEIARSQQLLGNQALNPHVRLYPPGTAGPLRARQLVHVLLVQLRLSVSAR